MKFPHIFTLSAWNNHSLLPTGQSTSWAVSISDESAAKVHFLNLDRVMGMDLCWIPPGSGGQIIPRISKDSWGKHIFLTPFWKSFNSELSSTGLAVCIPFFFVFLVWFLYVPQFKWLSWKYSPCSRNLQVWLQDIHGVWCRKHSDVGVWLFQIDLVSNSLKSSYFLLYFCLSWNSGGFFPQIFQTQEKADRVTMSNLAVNGLGKAFKIVSTIQYHRITDYLGWEGP